MRKQGWLITGQNSNLEISETRASESEYSYGKLVTYSEAKAEAIKQLQDHIQPYLQQIEDLQNDTFAVSNKLPPLKGWGQQRYSSRIVVAAPTKKRAMELAHISRHEIDNNWHRCSGSWWYHLAYEEGVWCEEKGVNGSGTGVFYRPIPREEADEIAAQHLNNYRVMPIDRLISIVGQKVVETGESSTGTPYRSTVTISIYDWRPEEVNVTGEVVDFLGWLGMGHASIYRKLPLPQTVDWLKDGF